MRIEKLVGDLQRAPVDRDPVHASFDATPYQAGVFEHLDVLRHAVLGHRESLPDRAHGQLAGLPQQRDNLAARGISQAMKYPAEPLLLAGLAAPRAQRVRPRGSFHELS